MLWPTIALAAGFVIVGTVGLKAANAVGKAYFIDQAQPPKLGRINVQIVKPDGRFPT